MQHRPRRGGGASRRPGPRPALVDRRGRAGRHPARRSRHRQTVPGEIVAVEDVDFDRTSFVRLEGADDLRSAHRGRRVAPQSGGGKGPHDVDGPAGFRDRSAGDFELAAHSPAVDAGTSIGVPQLDMLGRSRVDDPAVPNAGAGPSQVFDLGALERGRRRCPAPDAGGSGSCCVPGRAGRCGEREARRVSCCGSQRSARRGRVKQSGAPSGCGLRGMTPASSSGLDGRPTYGCPAGLGSALGGVVDRRGTGNRFSPRPRPLR